MIHVFERAGLNIAMDVSSGAVHVLDAPATALLRTVDEAALRAGDRQAIPQQLYREYEKKEVEGSFDELARLVEQGLLYSADDYSGFAGMLGPAPVKAMCLHIAHDCNLRCRYCFASTGGFGGERLLMPAEIAMKAMDLLVRISAGRRNLEVDFFGGEPLMNMEVVRQTVAYARSKEAEHGKVFRFTLTTNGVMLNDENIQFINDEMGNVVLSLDGRKEVNDRMRIRTDGGGSYDTIVPKFQKLVASRGDKEYYVRGTYTRYNTDFDEDVKELARLGFDQISVEPVVGPETDDYTIRKSDIEAIEQSYDRLMMHMHETRQQKGRGINFFHFMLDLDNGPCAIKRLKGCGCGNEYLAVTPDGELYPCHQFAGLPEYCMGTVYEGKVSQPLKQEFSAAHLLNKPDCASCWAKFYCSGGCNANNYLFCGSMLKPHNISCGLEKTRLECAIALKALALV